MTKTIIKAALAATVATGLFASPAIAADSETFTATARIVSPLTLTLDNGGLNFGTITKLPTLTTDTVVVGRAGGTATTSCGADLACTTPTAAAFTVTGSADQAVGITFDMPANPGLLMNGAASVPFTVDAPLSVTLSSLGTVSFEIGGEITVSSTTGDGTYENDVDVTVEYS